MWSISYTSSETIYMLLHNSDVTLPKKMFSHKKTILLWSSAIAYSVNESLVPTKYFISLLDHDLDTGKNNYLLVLISNTMLDDCIF